MLFNLLKNKKLKEVDQANIPVVAPIELAEKWFAEDFAEGQLLVDVYTTARNIIIKAPMAGVDLKNLDISLDNDFLTIKGRREVDEEARTGDYLYKECYWGTFSRSLVLPAEVDNKKIEAFLENGILTVILTKIGAPEKIIVKVKE